MKILNAVPGLRLLYDCLKTPLTDQDLGTVLERWLFLILTKDTIYTLELNIRFSIRETRELVRFPDYARLLSHFRSPVFQYKLITNTALTVSNSTKLTTIQPSLNSYCFSDISYQSRTVEHERIQQGIPLWDAQPILLCIHSRPHKAPYQATESSEILLIS